MAIADGPMSVTLGTTIIRCVVFICGDAGGKEGCGQVRFHSLVALQLTEYGMADL